MNAKKIMGAVLVALLAAALFVGAGAADEPKSLGTVFVYEKTDLSGTWTNAQGSVTFVDGVITGTVKEGVYTNGTHSITVNYPTAIITGIATDNFKSYAVVGGVLYNSATKLAISVISPAAPQPVELLVTNPEGVPKTAFELGVNYADLKNLDAAAIEKLFPETGTYKLQAIFDVASTPTVGELVDFTPESYLVGAEYTITVASSTDVAVTAEVDTIIEGETLVVTITGKPGETYEIALDDVFGIASLGTVTSPASGKITMPNDGKAVIYLESLKTGEGTITVKDTAGNEASVSIEVIEGEITVAADKASYFIGQNILLTGTSTGAKTLHFYIEGTNVDLARIGSLSATVEADKTWKQKITYDNLKAAVSAQDLEKLDAGTYTIYVTGAITGVNTNDVKTLEPYVTIAVPLKQPFLTATLQSTVVAQGSDLVVTGTAEAASAKGLRYYIFGTNFFDSNTTGVKSDSTYKITYPVEASKMAAGQYFLVVQHPMYDENFNIAPSADPAHKGSIILDTLGEASTATVTAENTLFKVNSRQTSNAAEALCQALDTQNIDDIYVKASFIVAAPTATMNPIPSEVAKGTKLTVSGTTNLGAGEIITVEMLSTAFAAVPKENVNSASFIALTTKVADDGTWEVTFDTTGLNLDEYTIRATVGEFITTAKVNVVEAAPEQPDTPDTPDVPDTPDTPDTPDVPETPGFGALAALAGLGAVAVLLLRRE